MAKVRIYEIANELNIQSKDIIEFLKEKNILKKTASSAIEGDVIDMVKGKFTKRKPERQEPETEKKKEAAKGKGTRDKDYFYKRYSWGRMPGYAGGGEASGKTLYSGDRRVGADSRAFWVYRGDC